VGKDIKWGGGSKPKVLKWEEWGLSREEEANAGKNS
jgi:hypothetical protein